VSRKEGKLSTPADDIREFVQAKYPQAGIDDEQDIFALGFVNSLFELELVMFIEKSFGFQVPNEEVKLDNFRTVAAMERLVARHSPAPAVAG
jgi:acyl carrier protein